MATERGERITADIVAAGRRQLAEVGPAALSLRAVAREIGVVSSAVYRYVSSRDELLTLLIIEAYDSLGDAADAAHAAASDGTAAERWAAVAHAVRDWALAHPHEYALVYGTPVPGYAAPETTVVAGTRVSRLLVRIVADAKRDRQWRAGKDAAVGADLSADFDVLRATLDLDLPDRTVLDVLVAWTQLYGLLSFEIFSQTRGLVTRHRDLFDAAIRRTAAHVGLR